MAEARPHIFLIYFDLKPKTEGEPLMDFVTVVQVISSEFHFSWVGDQKGDERGMREGCSLYRKLH